MDEEAGRKAAGGVISTLSVENPPINSMIGAVMVVSMGSNSNSNSSNGCQGK